MNETVVNTIGQLLPHIPAEGVHRDVALQRLTDICAGAAAARALNAAAAAAREAATDADPQSRVAADVLTIASELWNGEGVSIADGTDNDTRDRLARTVMSPAFDQLLRRWIGELRQAADARPASGACTVATALQVWQWTLTHFRRTSIAGDAPIVELAEAFCWLAAARAQVLASAVPAAAPAISQSFLEDLSRVGSARAAGTVAGLCAELVFGYRRHPAWDEEGCASCFNATDLDELEGIIPGIASCAHAHSDVIGADGSHAAKAGPCARRDGVEPFVALRSKLDGCLTGARLAKQRAAAALPAVAADALSSSTH